MPSPPKRQPRQQEQGCISQKDASGVQISSVSFPSKQTPLDVSFPQAVAAIATSTAMNSTAAGISVAPSFSSASSSSLTGDASGITILLSNHAKFGLSERVCYHFDLIETLKRVGGGFTNHRRERTVGIAGNTNAESETKAASKESAAEFSKPKEEYSPNDSINDVVNNNDQHNQCSHHRDPSYNASENSFPLHEPLCGVSALLECVPSIPPNKQTKRSRRIIRRRMLEFNSRANDALIEAEHPHQQGKNEDDKPNNERANNNEKGEDHGIKNESGGGFVADASKASIGKVKIVGGFNEEEKMLKKEGDLDNTDGCDRPKSPQEKENEIFIVSTSVKNSYDEKKLQGKAILPSSSTQHPTTKLHLPSHLPLKLSPSTRVSFAYRITSIALVIDASPSIISIYGDLGFSFNAASAYDANHNNSVDHCNHCSSPFTTNNGATSCPSCSACPLDRIQQTMRLFLKGLVQDIDGTPQAVADNQWRNPILAVTVLAVYPRQHDNNATNPIKENGGTNLPPLSPSNVGVLVRDYNVYDEKSALQLADAIHDWCRTDVEDIIASQTSSYQHHRHSTGIHNFSSLLLPQPKSNLEDILNAANAALSTLPQEGRPIIVLATDCRSVCCGSVLDLHKDAHRNLDVPLHVLDLSSSRSHGHYVDDGYSYGNGSGGRCASGTGAAATASSPTTSYSTFLNDEPKFLTHDETKASIYPLDQTDDSEALYDICLAKGGCFWDNQLLSQAVSTIAGQASLDSPLHSDHYFASRRRTLRPNALQWYTIFSLSPISPTTSGAWGRPPPPEYIRSRRQQHMRKVSDSSTLDPTVSGVLRGPVDQESRTILNDITSHGQLLPPLPASRTMFSTYFLSAVRVKGILLMRIIEGYRAKRYGHNTQDSDKVSIHFTLPLEFGTVLHYELQFVASPYHNPLVGSAHVKIELSGDPTFVQAVKNQFISHQVKSQRARPSTVARKVADGLCKYLRWVRKEDCLESYLCPLEWGDKLSMGSPFLRRIKTLNELHKHRHFRREKFEVICAKRTFEDGAGLLSEFMDTDHGEEELFECISSWSTQKITEKKYYVKQIDRTHVDLTAYCIVEIKQSTKVSRLFTITMDFFKGIYIKERISVVLSLKSCLSSCRDIVVLPKSLSDFLSVSSAPLAGDPQASCRSKLMETFYHHKSWDLVKDPELLPLLTKRRWQLGNFWLLDSTQSRAIFAKFVYEEGTDLNAASASNLYLIQYLVHSEPNHVTVNTYMDAPRGVFLSRRVAAGRRQKSAKQALLFRKIYVKIQGRDKKCSRALRSRTNLLSILQEKKKDFIDLNAYTPADQVDDVRRLLAYSSKIQKKLRFFRPGSGLANNILATLTTSLMLSGSFVTQFAKLSIDPDTSLGDIEPGTWFLVQHDWNTLSLVHFALSEKVTEGPHDDSEDLYTYRELTFYNVGISDLYYTKDDIADDDSTADNPSEYVSVSEVVDAIESAHGYNYARAAYLALRQDSSSEFSAFHSSDFAYALRFCAKQEIVNVFVSKESEAGVNTTGSNLTALIRNLVHPVPVVDDSFVSVADQTSEFSFCDDVSAQLIDDIIASAGHRSLETPEGLESECDSDSSDYDSETENMRLGDDVSVSQSESTNSTFYHSESGNKKLNCTDNVPPANTPPPLFVSFSLDGKNASIEDLSTLNKSSNLTAYITTFGSGKNSRNLMSNSTLSGLHAYVALQLRLHLNSFVAEQTLERLRYIGASIKEIDIRTAMKCLNEAGNTVTSKVPIQFYSSKIDSMVLASSPTGSEGDLEKGYALLQNEIETQDDMKMKRTRNGALVVVGSSTNDDPLPFWCFLQIKSQGFISIDVHHPHGKKAAEEVAAKAHNVASCTCKRVNQLFLLKHLYQMKTASRLLIAPKNTDKQFDDVEPTDIRSGFFECPVKFRTNFKLNHRCAKSKAKITFESSVLHNFAVSNRPGVFVYKDEDDHIFYMKFDYLNDSKDDDSIELLVYGVEEPGPSVTEQLTQLLRKRLISISLETLSSVLTKNPNFNLLPADISFLRSFEQTLSELDPEEKYKLDSHERIYELPENIYDPVMVLMLFRQNICGSGFFHRLHEVDDAPLDDSTTTSENSALVSGRNELENGIKLRFEPQDFTLFYNNCPSQLNPKYQALSTLTEKGKFFSRNTGSGIALIEFILLGKDGSLVETLLIGASPGNEDARLHIPPSFLKVRRISDSSSGHSANTACQSSYRIMVKVTNTTLSDLSALHDWIELTMNQVVAAWCIERHIERSRSGLLRKSGQILDEDLDACLGENRNHKRLSAIDEICCGSIVFERMLYFSNKLPHPAVKSLKFKGAVKATALAKVALELFEKVILSFAFGSRKQAHTDLEGVAMIRLNKQGQQSQAVSLSRNSTRGSDVCVIDMSSKSYRTIKDKPTDSPEYICILGLDGHQTGSKNNRVTGSVPPSALLFRDVALDNTGKDKTDFSRTMAALKSVKPSCFSRSFAAIMFVSRSSRRFFAYNWNPQILTTATMRFKEIEEETLRSEKHALHHQTMRCLSNGVPINSMEMNVTKNAVKTVHDPKGSGNTERLTSTGRTKSMSRGKDKQKDVPMQQQSISNNNIAPPRKIRRPMMIRRPTLIGKSVEGGAAQALAASRARASARSATSRVITTAKNHKEKANPSHNPASKESLSTPKSKADFTPEKSQMVPNKQAPYHTPHFDTADYSDSESLAAKISGQESDLKRTGSVHPVVIKVYHFMLKEFSSYVLQQRLTLKVSHFLTKKWLLIMREKDFSVATMDFILSRATLLRSFSSRLLMWTHNQVKTFLEFVAEEIVTRHNGVIVYPKRIAQFRQEKEISEQNASKSPLIFIQKDFWGLCSNKATVIVELKALKHLQLRNFVCYCRVWLLNSQEVKNGPTHVNPTKYKRKKNTSLSIYGLGASVLGNLVAEFCEALNLQNKIFDFGVKLLKDAIQLQCKEREKTKFLQLIKEMELRYPLYRQKQMGLLGQRLMHKTIQFDNSFDAVRLYQYICSNSPSYNVAKSNIDGECLSGKIREMNINVCFSFLPHEHTSFAFELFVLFSTKGENVDSYFHNDSSPYIQTISERIMWATEAAIRDIARTAAVNLRRDCLWEGFSLSGQYRCTRTIDSLRELCEMSHSTSIGGFCPQISALLFDPMDDLNMNWPTLLSAIKKEPLFSVSVSFGDEVFLFYFKKEDLFLMVKLNNKKAVEDVQVLTRENPSGEIFKESCKKITGVFGNWILHWIWHSL